MSKELPELTTKEAGLVKISLFGGPTVSIGESPVDTTPLQQLLLTLVFGHGSAGVSRSQIGLFLWGQDDASRSRDRIRQLLHRTSERVGRGVIGRRGDRLEPGPAAVQSDLDLLEELLHRGPLAEAAGLVAKGLAKRLPVAPGREFEDWRMAKETSLVERVRQAAARRWDQASEAGLWGEARDAAEALYIHFPTDPAVAAKLIEARVRTGSVASAEAVLRDLSATTCDQERLEELQDLIRRVSRLRLSRKRSRETGEAPAPVVGRQQEVATAVSALRDTSAGPLRFVLISGEGGIGKTRVLEQVEKEAVLAGFRCLSARSVEAEQRIPLNPMADALAEVDLARHLRALGPPWRAVIGSLLPVIDPEPLEKAPPIQETRVSRRLMDALFLLLERIAAEGPTVLLLDDLHWADATTITSLQFIQRRWTSGNLSVVATLRPDCVNSSDPVTAYLEGHQDLPVVAVQLRELSAGETGRLVDVVLGPSVDPRIRNRIGELGGGHPLYLTELCREYRAGRLHIPDGTPDQLVVPVSLQQIFRRRLDLLSPMSLRVAGLLAVKGRPMRLIEVADLTGLPLAECADWAEELNASRLVTLSGDRLTISHELFRRALYQQLGDARRAVLHRSVADHLSSNDEAVDEGELAVHYDRAGEADLALTHGWAAASRAVASGAVAEAAYFFELVMRHELDASRKAQATAELAHALHLGRSIERANPVLELAATRLRRAGEFGRALRTDIRRVEGLAETNAAPAEELLDRLAVIKREALRLTDWEAVALALDAELHLCHTLGDLRAIPPIFDSMREVTRCGTKSARALAHSGLAVQILFGDNPASALWHGRQGVRECDRLGEHRLRVLLRLLLVLQYGGRFYGAESARIVEEARLLAKTSGDLLRRFSLESNIAVAHLDSGNLEAAEVAMERSTAMLGSAELDMNRFNQAINGGELALATGDYERAERCFLLAQGFIGPKTPEYSESMVLAGLGLSAFGLGDLTAAKEMESSLPDDPEWWYFDPTLVTTFRCRMHGYRGNLPTATGLLKSVSQAVEGRLVLAWLKLTLFRAEVEMRLSPEKAAELAAKGLRVSNSLGLTDRRQQFAKLLRRLGRA